VIDELFAAIYANPDDDAPRHVLADHLSDRGDPRGEFISLQLARGRKRIGLARELELLQAHAAEWLGPLAPVIDVPHSRFERGFLAQAAIARNTKKLLRVLSPEPAWATVEHFVNGVPPQLLARGDFSALRAIALGAGEFRRIARRGIALAHVEQLKLGDSVDLGELARVFPNLRRAQLRFAPKSDELAALGAIGVRELAIERMSFFYEFDAPDYEALIEALCETRSPFERATVGEIVLRRGDDGMLHQVVA
jgi:uncharacterized protein (TIGR02996 family)